MCGIFGYIGPNDGVPIVINGLKALEYRGYDSVGIAWMDGGEIKARKRAGRVSELEQFDLPSSNLVIGHTRWATHGAPDAINAHPHFDSEGSLALVHNGIIENWEELGKGMRLLSQTDTEVAACVLGKAMAGPEEDVHMRVFESFGKMEGSFAFAFLSAAYPNFLFLARRYSPLIVGRMGEGEYLVASDILPMAQYTDQIFRLGEDEFSVIDSGGVRFYQLIDGVEWEHYAKFRASPAVAVGSTGLGDHEHYMHKEIHEQPEALQRFIDSGATKGDAGCGNFFSKIDHLVLIGQGTSYHACMIGRNFIESYDHCIVQAEYASDFRWRNAYLRDGSAIIAVSQSGETADTIDASNWQASTGNFTPTLSVVNVEHSTLARVCKEVLPLFAGPEIGVASTKAFTSQLAALMTLAAWGAESKSIDNGSLLYEVEQLPELVTKVLRVEARVKEVADKYSHCKNMLFLGRGEGYPLALEGALKLKEVSYIHAEGIDAAEMKHGPIALVDEEMPCFFIALQGRRYKKILSNMQEVRARGGRIIALATEGDKKVQSNADDVIYIPEASIMSCVTAAIPLQLFAYHVAVNLGRDVDRPRNLAKSVTVE